MAVSRHVSIAILILATLYLTGCATGPPQPALTAPPAEAPIRKVGEEWHWTNGVTTRVVAIDGDITIQLSNGPGVTCPDCRRHVDRNLVLVRLLDQNGADAAAQEVSLGYKILDFPLFVGKTWNSDQTLFSRGANRAYSYRNTFTVGAVENVKTKGSSPESVRRHTPGKTASCVDSAENKPTTLRTEDSTPSARRDPGASCAGNAPLAGRRLRRPGSSLLSARTLTLIAQPVFPNIMKSMN